MKKAVSILAVALFAGLCAPAYSASYGTVDGAKKPNPDQLAKKHGGSKGSKKSHKA